MPNDIEEQIATYFAWIEARSGFPLHASPAEIELTESSVIELDGPKHGRGPLRRTRLAVIGLLVAAIVVGVIVIASRPTTERREPANSVPSTDSPLVQQAEARREEAARRLAAQHAAQLAEEARKAEAAAQAAAAASSSTSLPSGNAPAEASYQPPDGPVPGLPGSAIQDVRMTDSTSGWVVTSDVLAHTADGGATWQSQPLPPSSNDRGWGKAFFLDSDHAWVVRPGTGDDVEVTRSDDGATTSKVTTIRPGFTGGIPAGVVFIDGSNGFVSIVDPAEDPTTFIRRAALYATVDGGDTFQQVSLDSPIPLAFSDAHTGWAAGQGLFVTTDGAATWTRVHPPLWDAPGLDPMGPSYQIITTSADLTVVKVVAPTGLEAAVDYVATDDLGKTWREVAPPDTDGVNNTGPQSTLMAVSATNWFGIQQSMGPDALMWTTSDGGNTYRGTHLPFPALTITMATPTIGWTTTATDVRATTDGGRTWTKVADLLG